MIPSMVEVCTLEIGQLQSLLDRLRKSSTIVDPTPLRQVFAEILRLSNEFIPSLAGAVVLDDPILKRQCADDLSRNELIFVACFGEKAKQLVGQRMAADRGIMGTAYRGSSHKCMHDSGMISPITRRPQDEE